MSMSNRSSISGSHEDAQTNLEKTCECIKFVNDIYEQYYTIEKRHKEGLSQMIEATAKLHEHSDYFKCSGTSGFYQEIADNLMKHANSRVIQIEQLLVSLEIKGVCRG